MTRPGEDAPDVLLVEDDERLAPLVVRHLADSGFRTAWVRDAESARRRIAERTPDIAILDVMLPGEDGLSLCRRLRAMHDFGIVMVTARGEESDRIRGLGLGADDYLPKPFSLWELEARMRAVLRRTVRPSRGGAQPWSAGPFRVDPAARAITRHGQPLTLTRSEFDLLAMFLAEPGRVMTRERLLGCVQGGDTDATDRAIDTHISNLRRKIEDDARAPRHLETVWGVGYRLRLP